MKMLAWDVKQVENPFMKFGTNGVPMAHHRLILGQNGATIPTGLFIWLPGLREAIFEPTIKKTYAKKMSNIFGNIFI